MTARGVGRAGAARAVPPAAMVVATAGAVPGRWVLIDGELGDESVEVVVQPPDSRVYAVAVAFQVVVEMADGCRHRLLDSADRRGREPRPTAADARYLVPRFGPKNLSGSGDRFAA